MKDIRLWGILILALAVRAVMLHSMFTEERMAQTELPQEYRGLVCSLKTHKVFGEKDLIKSFAASMNGGNGDVFRHEISRTPAYPALMWGLRCIYGDSRYLSAKTSHRRRPFTEMTVLQSFQVLLDLHLVLLTFLLGWAMAGHGAGLIAALFQAVSPLAAAASCRILPDTIFAFLLMLAVLLLVRHFRTGRWWSLLSASVVVAGACYFDPMGQAFAVVMVLVVAFRPKRIRRTLAFAGVLVACLAPWVVRNAALAEYWGFSSAPTDSLYWDSAAVVEAHRQSTSAEKVRQQFRLAEEGGKPAIVRIVELAESVDMMVKLRSSPDGKMDRQAFVKAVKMAQPPSDTPCGLRAGGLTRYRRERAWGIISAHPVDFFGQHLAGDMAFWEPAAINVLGVLGNHPASGELLDALTGRGLWFIDRDTLPGCVTTGAILCWIMLVIVAIRCFGILLCGLWCLRPRMTAAGWLCLLLVLTAWLLPGSANSARFRVPVEPILSVTAAIGWLGLVGWWRRNGNHTAPQKRDTVTGEV